MSSLGLTQSRGESITPSKPRPENDHAHLEPCADQESRSMKSGVADERPDAAIMAPIERIARFMETLDFRFLDDAFTEREVVLIENFPPYVFEGADAVERWAKGFAGHAKNIRGLRHSFGEPHDFRRDGEVA